MSKALGNLFIVAAPSGAGKSSLINALIKSPDSNSCSLSGLQLSVSHTTRSPRPGEKDGVHYHFVNHGQFEAMIKDQAFYEYAEVFGNYYGTSKAAIADKLNEGIDVFLDIDWQGARQIREQHPSVKSIFILPPTKQALRERLIGRGQDEEDVIEKRMREAVSEMSHYDEFDYVILNDVFEQALEEFKAIVLAARLDLGKQQIRNESIINELLHSS